MVREGGNEDSAVIRPQGFFDENTYLVHFQDDGRQLTFSGLQLKRDGVRVNLPPLQSAEIVYIEPLK